MQAILISSISCGDNKLSEMLQENVGGIVQLNTVKECNVGIRYLHVKRDLIRFALSYSSGLVDISHKESKTTGESEMKTTQEAHSQSQRTANSIGCAWSSSAGMRNYRRDAYANDDSYSNSGKSGTSNSNRNAYDRSTAWQNGVTHFYNMLKVKDIGGGFGWSQNRSDGTSRAKGTSGNSPQLTTNQPDPIPAPNISATVGVSDFSLIGMFPLQPLAAAAEQIGSQVNAYINSNEFTPNASSVPWASVTDCPDVTAPTSTDANLADAAQNFNCGTPVSFRRYGEDKVSISVGFTVPGFSISLKGDINSMSSISIQSYCASSGSYSKDTVHAKLRFSQTSDGTGRTYATNVQTGGSQKDRWSHSDSDERTSSYTDAESKGIAESTFESHYISDRSSHTQKEGNGQSTSQAKSTTKVRGGGNSESVSSEEVRYWSQIFDSLQTMYEAANREIENANKSRSANFRPISGKVPNKAICNNPCMTNFYSKNYVF